MVSCSWSSSSSNYRLPPMLSFQMKYYIHHLASSLQRKVCWWLSRTQSFPFREPKWASCVCKKVEETR
ncbi:hypothetical protein Pint_20999 [Pistacia integerrima]|uniref:Uncharacterized protein n=1 Tax=Pistacia integerrima TaxID=434235 RepID=A0ACC0XA66_9ROSI|nr:hypothetical protein Pint_20999 [Pistacia integerrima]